MININIIIYLQKFFDLQQFVGGIKASGGGETPED